MAWSWRFPFFPTRADCHWQKLFRDWSAWWLINNPPCREYTDKVLPSGREKGDWKTKSCSGKRELIFHICSTSTHVFPCSPSVVAESADEWISYNCKIKLGLSPDTQIFPKLVAGITVYKYIWFLRMLNTKPYSILWLKCIVISGEEKYYPSRTTHHKFLFSKREFVFSCLSTPDTRIGSTPTFCYMLSLVWDSSLPLLIITPWKA